MLLGMVVSSWNMRGDGAFWPGTTLPRNWPPLSREPRNTSTRAMPLVPSVALGSYAAPEMMYPPCDNRSPGFGLPRLSTGGPAGQVVVPGRLWAPAGIQPAQRNAADVTVSAAAAPSLR